MDITNAQDIDFARAALAALDPALAVAHAATPIWGWRTRQGGFAGLVKMVVEQQVSVASANAVWTRLQTGLGEVTPQTVLSRDVEGLKRFGLSGPKARYARAIALAHERREINFDDLNSLDDAEATSALVSLIGIGRWTAEVYLMFCEGRVDLFPAGDVALQEALRVADGASKRLSQKALYARADNWRPFRGVAAHLLWAYYGVLKRGEITVLPVVGPS